MNIFKAESSKPAEMEKIATNASAREMIDKPEKRGSKVAVLDVWKRIPDDGEDRNHIPPATGKLVLLRIVQLSLAVVFLVLAAFAAFTLNTANASGFAFSFFVFSWTVVYFVYLVVAIRWYPITYHWIAHLVLEGLTNIFWLASWATFASYATALNVAGAGRGLARRDRDDDDDGPSAGIAAGLAAAGLGPKAAKAGNAASLRSAADIAIAVDAGIGAVIWVLFIVTLFTTGTSILAHRKSTSKGKASAAV